MKALKYITGKIPFFKSLKKTNTENTEETDHFEFNYPKFGINLYRGLTAKKGSKSLLTQMYCKENETLFI